MKISISCLTVIFLYYSANAQTPQIALVKPNDSTSMFTTLQAAYDAATNDDYIYLPAGTFSVNEINKTIHIKGAGMNIDSSAATGISRMPYIVITENGAGGSIEGVYFYAGQGDGASILMKNLSSSPAVSYDISNCHLSNKLFSNNGSWENLTLKNNYIGGTFSIHGNISNSLITNNIINGGIAATSNLLVSNNIFFHTPDYTPMSLTNNSTYNNNIFQIYQWVTVANSVFNNNVNISPDINTNQIYNSVTETWDNIFTDPGTTAGTNTWCGCPVWLYNVHRNYYIKSTSACHNSGTDGTDRGIYGSVNFSWKDGSIPSNPHIYFKNVAATTNTDGKLMIHFKVRTNN